jgi:hypothetical protein
VAAPVPVKSKCVLLFAKIILSCYETQQLILGTSAAIWWVTEPHWLTVIRQIDVGQIVTAPFFS